MNYKFIKLHFSTAVHFGDGGLMTCMNTLYADTIFSALCIQASRMSSATLDDLVSLVKSGNVKISDAFPYIGEKYYLPKPLLSVDSVDETDDEIANSIKKKAAKKLAYIESNRYEEYLSGNADVVVMEEMFSKNFGEYSLVHKNHIVEGADTVPFAISVFKYHENAGLYIIVQYGSDSEFDVLLKCFNSLSVEGIGGRITSGYGKFSVEVCDLSEEFITTLQNYTDRNIVLTTSIPDENEMSVMEDANYLLVKRGGFIASNTYSDTYRKKKEVYMAKAGSVFVKQYNGTLIDVSDGEGTHPVYKYSIPMFMGV